MDPNEAKNAPREDPDFHALRERRQFDRDLLVKKSMEAGMSREAAEKHADEHYEGEAHGKSAEEATQELREHGIDNRDL